MKPGTPRPAGSASARSLAGLLLLIAAVGGATAWWQDHAERRVGDQLVQLARPGDIRLLSSTTCAYCAQARAWLRERKLPFDECFIERDAACRATFDALHAPGTPMVLVRGQAQAGFDPQRVLQALR